MFQWYYTDQTYSNNVVLPIYPRSLHPPSFAAHHSYAMRVLLQRRLSAGPRPAPLGYTVALCAPTSILTLGQNKCVASFPGIVPAVMLLMFLALGQERVAVLRPI